MPRTGRPRGAAKPTELKRLEGNPGKRPLPAAPVPGEGAVSVRDAGVPDPPYPLEDVGLFWWYQTWQAGSEWLSPTADLQLIYDIAKNRQQSQALEQKISELEDTFYETKAGQLVTHPYITQLRALEVQRTAWLAAIGFTPADRARLGLTEVRTMDAYDDYREKVRAREQSGTVATDVLDPSAFRD